MESNTIFPPLQVAIDHFKILYMFLLPV